MLAGVILLVTSIWTGPVNDGRRMLAAGDLEQGLEQFSLAEQRFEGFGPAKQVLSDDYVAAVGNQFYILYQLGKFDELLEKAASSPVFSPVHFWTGCALFRRAGTETEVQAQIAWLERASEEFKQVLRLEPDNWDAKYNFELTRHIIASLRDEDEPPPQMLELLRPRPRQGEVDFQQTG